MWQQSYFPCLVSHNMFPTLYVKSLQCTVWCVCASFPCYWGGPSPCPWGPSLLQERGSQDFLWSESLRGLAETETEMGGGGGYASLDVCCRWSAMWVTILEFGPHKYQSMTPDTQQQLTRTMWPASLMNSGCHPVIQVQPHLLRTRS